MSRSSGSRWIPIKSQHREIAFQLQRRFARRREREAQKTRPQKGASTRLAASNRAQAFSSLLSTRLRTECDSTASDCRGKQASLSANVPVDHVICFCLCINTRSSCVADCVLSCPLRRSDTFQRCEISRGEFETNFRVLGISNLKLRNVLKLSNCRFY